VKENEWDDGGENEILIVGAHTERGRIVLATVNDSPPSDDDIQDEDFVWDGEDSEDVSLDEEINNSDSSEELEAHVE